MTGQSKVAEIEVKEKKQTSALYVASGMGAASTSMMVASATAMVSALKNGDEVATAKFVGLMSACASAIELLLGPILGQLSDEYGRKPFMIMSTSIIAAFHGLVALFPRLEFIFLDTAISGAMGFCFMNQFQAAVADMFASKSVEKMALTNTQMGAASGTGLALGPLLGASLAGRQAYGVSALGYAATAFWIGNQVEETLSTDKHNAFDLFASNPLSFVKFFKNEIMAKSASTLVLQSFANMPNIWTLNFLYLKTVLGYGQQGVGIFIFGFSITQIFGAILTNSIIKSLGPGAYTRIGNLAFIIGLGIMGSAKSARHLALSLFFSMFGTQRGIEARSLLSAHGAAAGMGQGELQGDLANFIGVGKVVAPLLYSKVFAWAMSEGRSMPGLPYLLPSCLVAAAHLLFSTVSKEEPIKQE